MNKYLFSLITFMLIYAMSHAQFSQDQQAQIDSLNLIIKESKQDTSIAHAYVMLSEIMYVSNLDTMIFLCEQAKFIAEKSLKKTSLNTEQKISFQNTSAIALNNIGFVHHLHGDHLIALEHFMESLEIMKKIGNQVGIAHAYNNIGAMHNSLGDVDKALEYYQKSLKLARELGNTKSIAYSLNNIGYIYKNQGDLSVALDYYKESLKVGLEIGDKANIANTYNNIGVLYKDLGDYPLALEYHHNALKIQEKIEHKKGIASTLGNIGHIYNLQGDIPLSLDYYHKALNIREEIGEKSGVALSLSSIGSIHKNQGDNDLAMEYYQKSLKINEEIGEKDHIAESLSNIGEILADQGQLLHALEYYQKSLKIREELKNSQGTAITLNYIGGIYMEQDNFPQALVHFRRSLKINEEIGEKIGIAKSLINIGSVYEGEGDYTNAVKYGKEGLNIARELGAVQTISQVSYLLFIAYKMKGRYEESLEMYELYTEMHDSLLNEKNTRAVTIQEMNYVHEKEQQQKEAAYNIELNRQKLIKNFSIMGSALLLLLAFVSYRSYRSKRKSNIQLFAQKEEILTANEELNLQKEKLKSTLENLKRTQSQLIESGKMSALGSLVAGVAHEINTPLGVGITAISSLQEETRRMAELYIKKKISRTDFKEYISSTNKLATLIRKNLERTASLVQSFKQVSVDQSSEQQREFYFKSYMEDILSSLYPRFKERDIEINIECDEELKLNSYPGVFAQISTNLLLNCIIHGFDEKQKGKISIVVRKINGELEIRYIDDGKGIPEEILSKVFNPFITSDHRKGTGLGLHIVYNLVTQKLNGTIKCDSEPEKGAMFTITLPIT